MSALAPLRAQAEHLATSLRARGHTVTLAESCTGGLIAAALTTVPGASEVFWGGVVSYDNAAKRRCLGVPSETLSRHGAVSKQVAQAMARGARRASGSTWSVAVTGVAGPGGGTREKPVGTVWLALDGPSPGVRRHRFAGDRDEVREAAAREAMRWLVSRVDPVSPASHPPTSHASEDAP